MYVFQDCHGNNKAKICKNINWSQSGVLLLGIVLLKSMSLNLDIFHLITIGRALVVGSIASPHSTFGQKAG